MLASVWKRAQERETPKQEVHASALASVKQDKLSCCPTASDEGCFDTAYHEPLQHGRGMMELRLLTRFV